MRKLTGFICGALLFAVISLILTGYGNRNSHRTINKLVVEQFQKNFIATAFPLEKFKLYNIVFSGEDNLPGTFVTEGGLFKYNIVEEKQKHNPLTWVVHGGFSADEPEVFASFRHFYDPTQPEGNRYLHNHLDESGDLNPEIDHLKWAVDHAEHQYNWKNAKASVVAALTGEDIAERNENMAFAWRALGEALHMVADMGCPAHVRDDAHAAEPFSGFKLGSPDPYEEIIEDLGNDELIKLFNAGKTDTDYRDSFRKAETIQQIATFLAGYTNRNFFTTQTISGKEIQPLIHPERTYPSPKLEQCSYNDDEMVYKKTISGNEVLMCTDKRFSIGGINIQGYPKIDVVCAKSQATALLPQIVEAGSNLVRLFIPHLEIIIEGYDEENERIKGKVLHTIDKEYTTKINYTGKVAILGTKKMNKITEVDCETGVFDAKIDKSDFTGIDWEKHGVYGEIEFGGIYIKSEPYTRAEEKRINYIDLQAFWKTSYTETIDGKSSNSEGSDMAVTSFTTITTNGNTVVGSDESTGTGYKTNYSFEIKFSGNDIQSFTYNDSTYYSGGAYTSTFLEGGFIKGEKLNISGTNGYKYSGITHEIITSYRYIKSVQENNYYKVANKVSPDNNELLTIHINY